MSRLLPWGPIRSSTSDPVVDIEKLIIDFAWTEVARTSCLDRLLRNKRYTLDVNWSYFDISHHVTSFQPRPRDSLGVHHSAGGKAGDASALLDQLKSGQAVLHRDLCLFRTEFKNASRETQTFTFKTERTTTSRCEIKLQRGFKIGSSVDVRVNIPKVEACRVTGSLSGELHVTKETGQTFEEVLTWSVDSQVSVEPRSRATAALLIREEEVNADLTVDSIIRPLYDYIPVYIRCRKTGKPLQLLELMSSNLPDILSESEGFTKVGECAVKRETKGVARLVYGAEQVVDLRTFSLDPADYNLDSFDNPPGANKSSAAAAAKA